MISRDCILILTGWYVDVLWQLSVRVLIQGDTAFGALLAQTIARQIGFTVLRYTICHTNSRTVFWKVYKVY